MIPDNDLFASNISKMNARYFTQIGNMNITSVLISIVIGSFISFFMSVQALLILAFSLIVVDWITGVLASAKQKRIEAAKKNKRLRRVIESKKLRDTIDKLLVYLLLILVSRGIGFTLMGYSTTISPLPYIVAMYITYTEYISILENVEKVTGMTGKKAIKNFLQGKFFPEMDECKDEKK